MHPNSLRLWLGSILTLTGLVLVCSWHTIFDILLKKHLALNPGSSTFETWKAPPFYLELTLYCYNLTNPDQLHKPNFKPEYDELGPYFFWEKNEKENIVWNDNHTITYQVRRTTFFDADKSNGSQDDVITFLNTAALGGSYSSRFWTAWSTIPLAATMRMMGAKVLITKTFREMISEGYEDPLLTMSNVVPGMRSMGEMTDRIGVFYERNGSMYFDGVVNMGTGADDISKVGQLYNWNYRNRSSNFEGPCGELSGTQAEMFAPLPFRDPHLAVFVPEVCKTLNLKYLKDQEINGILGYQYFLSADALDNGTLHPENECNCGGECLPRGVVNASSCLRDLPLFLSLPHFLYADPSYRDQVGGVSPPDEVQHLFHVTVEPTTGIPLEAVFRFQMNLYLRKNRKIGLFSDVPNVMTPLLWLEKRFRMPADIVSTLKLMLWMPVIGVWFAIVLLLLGLCILACTVLPRLRRNKHSDDLGELQNGMVAKENLSNIQLQTKETESIVNAEAKEKNNLEDRRKELSPDLNGSTVL